MNTWQDYTGEVIKTLNSTGDFIKDLFYVTTKIQIEAAEMCQHVVKYLQHGKKLDFTKIEEEAGDVLYYVAAKEWLENGENLDKQDFDLLLSTESAKQPVNIYDCINDILFEDVNNFCVEKIVANIANFLKWSLEEQTGIKDGGEDIIKVACQKNIIKLRKRHGKTYNQEFYLGKE